MVWRKLRLGWWESDDRELDLVIGRNGGMFQVVVYPYGVGEGRVLKEFRRADAADSYVSLYMRKHP